MTKVLILMSNTGGGHRASAEALKEAFIEVDGPEISVHIVDAWVDHTPWPLNQLPRSYEFLAGRTPGLYDFLFNLAKRPAFITPLLDLAARWSGSSVMQVIQDYSPDLIISVHPLMQAAALQILARGKYPVPLMTVVTDLASFHPCWFHPGVTLCFVPNEEGYTQALKAGLRPEQIRQCGLPIRLAFSQPDRPKAELRLALGMEPDVPAALLVGGGEGMGPVEDIARAVAVRLAQEAGNRDRPAGQLAVICGRNQRLRDRLNTLNWLIPTSINGFVTNMADWMSACDCIITKAGPGTIAEAMSRGLPILLSGFIPGQETENVAYVTDNGIGVHSPNPEQMAEIVSHWFGSGQDDLACMAHKARDLASPRAALHIAEEISRVLAPSDVIPSAFTNEATSCPSDRDAER